MENIRIQIDSEIENLLPTTYKILQSAQLTVHPYVYKVILSGSRGLAGNFKDDSDIDLSLLVENDRFHNAEDKEKVLREILDTTLQAWKSTVELDTVAVFNINNCGLECFDSISFNHTSCKETGIDCMGLYKTQKGFNGFVPKIGIDIRKICPTVTVWER